MMKNKNLILIVIVIIILLSVWVIFLIDKNYKANNVVSENTSFELIYEDGNNEEINVILKKDEKKEIDYNVCTYGGNVRVKINNQFFDLREALLLKKIEPTDIIDNAKNTKGIIFDMYKDGGTTVYKYNDFCIVKFNTLDGNKDLYISKLDFSYDKLNTVKFL